MWRLTSLALPCQNDVLYKIFWPVITSLNFSSLCLKFAFISKFLQELIRMNKMVSDTEWEMWKWRKLQRNSQNWRVHNTITSLGRISCIESIQRTNTSSTFLMANTLDTDNSYQLFRAGLSPEWDDKTEHGGRWAVYGERTLIDPDIINNQWFQILQLVTNARQNFGDYSTQIDGCVIDIRWNNYRISLWTKDKYNKDACMAIGEIVQRAVWPTKDWKYEEHNANHEQKSSIRVQPIYKLSPLRQF